MWVTGKGKSQVSIPKRVSEALKLILSSSQMIPQRQVSIPKRVSEALKHHISLADLCFYPVSIPKRVSEALKR